MAKQPLRIIYMGTPEFAVPSLEVLVENGYNIVAVVTAPDKPAGRGMQLQSSAVKKCAQQYNIPVLQPDKLKNPEFIAQLRSFNANLQIVVAFRMLPEIVWRMPQLGTFNLHGSLLPQYRGAAPINWAVANGETETGVTTFFLQHEIDTGDLLFQEKEPIYPTDTAGTLYERLMQKGAKLVLKTVQAIENQDYHPFPQPELPHVANAPKIHTETCELHFHLPAAKLHNLVRGMAPFPAAWAIINGKKYKIFATSVIDQLSNQAPGTVLSDHKTYAHIQTGDKLLAIEELQAEGKKRMTVVDFLRGNKF